MFNKGYIAINPKEIEKYDKEIIIAVQRINVEDAEKYDSYEEIPKNILVEIWHYEDGKKYKNQLDYLYREKNLGTRYIQAYKKDTTEEYIKKDLEKKGYTNIKTSEELRLDGIKRKGRGKDKKPRIRRTKEQMIKDNNYIQIAVNINKNNFEILKWLNFTDEDIDKLVNDSIRNHIIGIKDNVLNIFKNFED
jgi:hypothetical protein